MDEHPITLAQMRLHGLAHVSAFFRSKDEEYDVLVPYILEGIDAGDLAVHLVDPLLVDDHRSRLAQAGIAVDQLEGRGQLRILDWHETYLRGGRFELDAMIELVEETIVKGLRDGFGRTRFIGQMEWALEDRLGVGDLVEYEAWVNNILSRWRQPGICVYDVSRWGAGLALDIVRTHPLVLIGGIIQENPFFIDRHKFLRELAIASVA
jgi:DcmR-like sensory protein